MAGIFNVLVVLVLLPLSYGIILASALVAPRTTPRLIANSVKSTRDLLDDV